MEAHHRRSAPGSLAILSCLLMAKMLAAAPQPDELPESLPTLHPHRLDPVVTAAVREAHRRMETPECRELFRDFRDAGGRTAQENLDSIGVTGQSYLGWLWFVDGSGQIRCRDARVVAFTVPGSRVVYFCGDRFRHQLERRGLGALAVTILHEELHTLGVGEDPPSSLEITRRVEVRCGR